MPEFLKDFGEKLRHQTTDDIKDLEEKILHCRAEIARMDLTARIT